MILLVLPADLGPIARSIAPGATVVQSLEGQSGAVYALGYAEGADAIALILLSQPGSLAGAVLLRPGKVAPPDALAELDNVPVLAIPSRDGSHAVPQLLAKAGAALDLAVQDSDEGLVPQDFALAKRWLAQFA
jgi:phospholipase/carboxylesterase